MSGTAEVSKLDSINVNVLKPSEGEHLHGGHRHERHDLLHLLHEHPDLAARGDWHQFIGLLGLEPLWWILLLPLLVHIYRSVCFLEPPFKNCKIHRIESWPAVCDKKTDRLPVRDPKARTGEGCSLQLAGQPYPGLSSPFRRDHFESFSAWLWWMLQADAQRKLELTFSP